MVWLTAFLLYLTGMMAFGWINLFNSNQEFFSKMTCRTILIPPEVEPAEAPTNNKEKNIIETNGGQSA